MTTAGHMACLWPVCASSSRTLEKSSSRDVRKTSGAKTLNNFSRLGRVDPVAWMGASNVSANGRHENRAGCSCGDMWLGDGHHLVTQAGFALDDGRNPTSPSAPPCCVRPGGLGHSRLARADSRSLADSAGREEVPGQRLAGGAESLKAALVHPEVAWRHARRPQHWDGTLGPWLDRTPAASTPIGRTWRRRVGREPQPKALAEGATLRLATRQAAVVLEDAGSLLEVGSPVTGIPGRGTGPVGRQIIGRLRMVRIGDIPTRMRHLSPCTTRVAGSADARSVAQCLARRICRFA